jgi:hypothetical protein
MEIEDFIIELIKVDAKHNKLIAGILDVLNEDWLEPILPSDEEDLETKIMDFMGIPKNDYDDEKNPDGFCRDFTSEGYWELRDTGRYEEAYQFLQYVAEEIKKGESKNNND